MQEIIRGYDIKVKITVLCSKRCIKTKDLVQRAIDITSYYIRSYHIKIKIKVKILCSKSLCSNEL